jgi:hypothetical protein
MIKKIITGGCSFSDCNTPYTWPHVLSKLLGNTIEYEHLGLSSQGNDLIQKKLSLAVIESLEKYRPEEILVIPMWSGTERKAFYVNSPKEIQTIVDTWAPKNCWWATQFADLKNKVSTPKKLRTSNGWYAEYNIDGGWYICNFSIEDDSIGELFFKITHDRINAVHETIQNIVTLQHTCKIHGVNLVHQFYMDYVLNDIEENKDHQLVWYLYKQFDKTLMVESNAIYEYLNKNPKFFVDPNYDTHPNSLGHIHWVTQVLLPNLKKRNLV